jgi:hypothetical protein
MRRPILSSLMLLFAAAARAADSGEASEDFRARQAQAIWNLQVLEGMIRPMPDPGSERSTPPAVAAYGRLLSENVGAMQRIDFSASTDEQRRQAAEGWQAIAVGARDLAGLSRNRRLDRFAQLLTELETRCRSAAKGL